MKISYIVNVDLDDKEARIVQISSNAKVFHKKLGDNFKLVTAGNNKKYDYHLPIWVNNIKRESSKLRKLLFHIGAIKYIVKSDIVYSRNLSVLYLANLFGKKIVWEMHDGVTGKINQKILHKIKNNIKIISVSEAQIGYVSFNFGIDVKSFILGRNGVFLERYNNLRGISKIDLREKLSLPINKTIVMHTGSLYEGRGAELFEVIIKNFPEIYFVQVGGSKEYVDKWKKYYKSYNNFQIIGHQDNDTLIRYQMSADLLFLPMTKKNPIWWCTSPMKIFEYMATGIPILGSNIGSVGEVITEKNAIVFNPEDEDCIVNGVKFFLGNKQEVNKLAQKALEDIIQRYSWEIRGNNILEFVKN